MAFALFLTELKFWVGLIHVVDGLLLIFLVLLHSGKGGGLSDMFGGGLGATAAGSTVAERNLDRITVSPPWSSPSRRSPSASSCSAALRRGRRPAGARDRSRFGPRPGRAGDGLLRRRQRRRRCDGGAPATGTHDLGDASTPTCRSSGARCASASGRLSSLDPADASPESASAAIAADLLFDGLTVVAPRRGPRRAGDRRRRGRPTDGGRTWRFALDPAARFSDGSAVTAGDVEVHPRAAWRTARPTSLAAARLDAVTGYADFVAGTSRRPRRHPGHRRRPPSRSPSTGRWRRCPSCCRRRRSAIVPRAVVEAADAGGEGVAALRRGADRRHRPVPVRRARRRHDRPEPSRRRPCVPRPDRAPPARRPRRRLRRVHLRRPRLDAGPAVAGRRRPPSATASTASFRSRPSCSSASTWPTRASPTSDSARRSPPPSTATRSSTPCTSAWRRRC